MAYVRFDCDRDSFFLIASVCKRYEAIAKRVGIEVDARISRIMDLSACHLNGTPLRLKQLLAAPEPEFLRDVGGISRFMDRETGLLDPCFVPMYRDEELRQAANDALTNARWPA